MIIDDYSRTIWSIHPVLDRTPKRSTIPRPPRPMCSDDVNFHGIFLINGNVHCFGDAPVGDLLPVLAIIGGAENAETGRFVDNPYVRRLNFIHRVALNIIPSQMLPCFAGVVRLVEPGTVGASTHRSACVIITNCTGKDAYVLSKSIACDE